MQGEENEDINKGRIVLYKKDNITVEQQPHEQGLQVVLYENDEPKQDTLYFFDQQSHVYDIRGEYENRKYKNGKVIYGEHYYPELGCIEIRHYDDKEDLNQKTISIYPNERVRKGTCEISFKLHDEEEKEEKEYKIKYPGLGRLKYTVQETTYQDNETLNIGKKRVDKQEFEHARKEMKENNLKKLITLQNLYYEKNYYENLLG